jgi:hypothetical protein
MISSAHLIFFVREQAASARLYSAILDRPPTLDVPGMTEFALCGGALPPSSLRSFDVRVRAATARLDAHAVFNQPVREFSGDGR